MLKNIFSPKDFTQKGIHHYLNTVENLAAKKKIIQQWQNNIISEKIYQLSETQLDMMFIHQIFGEVLGYEYQNANHWNIEIKPKTQEDSTRPDATLGFFSTKGNKITKALIELKSADINLDKTQLRQKKASPVEQAFAYVPKMAGQCNWVIVSNFLEIRLYHATDSTRYEIFELMNLLQEEELARFFFLLQKDRLFLEKTQSPIDQLYQERRIFEENISNEFYFAYEDIRQTLYQTLCQQNPNLNPTTVYEATQKLIDRIIFMCFVRDTIPMMNVLGKLKDTYEQLDGLYEYENRFWNDLKGVFRSFDKGYGQKIPHFNGGLFKLDEMVDKKLNLLDFQLLPLVEFVLKYDFQSELNVNLLGHIFEQSLRKENTPNQPNQRKQDGIFYTPDFITQYITRITIGAYLEEQKENLLQKHQEENLAFWKDYQQILENLKILDPACGSGAFLTQVFHFLFDEWKILKKEVERLQNKGRTPLKKANMGVFATKDASADFQEDWKIKKKIVQNNLYGFDLNNQSVQITKLALWLLTANRFVTLADLSENILEQNTLANLKKQPFFDIIIGNPPYVRQELLGETQKTALQKNFPEVYNGIADLYVYFYAQALNLLKEGGFLGFITPNKWLKTKYGEGLRTLLKPLKILQITDFFELPVFEDASTEPLIIALKKQNSQQDFDYFPITKKDLLNGNSKTKTRELLINFAEKLKKPIRIQKQNLDKNAWVFASASTQNQLDKITGKNPLQYEGKTLKIVTLNEYTNNSIYFGIKTGLNKAFIIDRQTKEKLIKADAKSTELIKPYINATDIKKWHLEDKKEWFFINTGFDIEISPKNYPAIFQHLKQFEKELEARQDKGKTAYNLRACAYYDEFEKPKIVYIYTATKHYFYYDIENYYVNNSSYIISNADLFLSAYLNSSIFEYYKKQVFVAYGNAEEGGRNKLDYNKMVNVPVPMLSASQKKPFETLVTQLQMLSQKLQTERESFIKTSLLELKPEAISQKLNDWYALEWQALLDELKKQKAKPTHQQKKELLAIFEREKELCQSIVAQITQAEQRLDKMFLEMYGQ